MKVSPTFARYKNDQILERDKHVAKVQKKLFE